MGSRIVVIFGLALPPGMARAFAQPGTSAADPEYGKKLAGQPCSNCHLVGTGEQHQANADIQSFPEIANKEDQSAGEIRAHIVVPKHPMPAIPLTQGELADLAAYILTLPESRLTAGRTPIRSVIQARGVAS